MHREALVFNGSYWIQQTLKQKSLYLQQIFFVKESYMRPTAKCLWHNWKLQWQFLNDEWSTVFHWVKLWHPKRHIFLKNHPPLLSEGYLWWKTSEFWIKYFFQVIGVKAEPATDTPQHEWVGCSTLSFRPPIWDYHAQLSPRILPPFRAGGPPQLLKTTENEHEEPAADKQVELLFRWHRRSGS